MPHPTAGRDFIIDSLRQELLGPAPAGKPLDVPFRDRESSYGPWTDQETGEEVLERDPLVRYGVGVLYPAGVTDSSAQDPDGTVVAGLAAEEPGEAGNARWTAPDPKHTGNSDDADFDLAGANERKPSAMGLSFLLERGDRTALEVELDAGRYRELPVDIPGAGTRTWWVRSKVRAVWQLSPQQLAAVPAVLRDLQPSADDHYGLEGLGLRLTANLRQHPDGLLVTLALTNNSRMDRRALAARCLFQTGFTATPRGGSLLPYPEAGDASPHPDDASFRLLYRHARTYAVGHGCAASWKDPDRGSSPSRVKADPLPEYQVPRITPDIRRADGTPLTVSMADLARPDSGGLAQLQELLFAYDSWISARRREADLFEGEFHATAKRHVEQCETALKRMREGFALISDEDSDIARAFRIANQAMHDQQQRSGAERRPTTVESGRVQVQPARAPNEGDKRPVRGQWRAFQIAFLLASLPSTADPAHPDRRSVDLIFFPTGGGKTEAYLGLSAFAMVLRRLRDSGDSSVTVLMRYTLRLLTTQQFLRAAALVCALEVIRRGRDDLGGEPFSIGIWVGGESTPNSHTDAVSALNRLGSGGDNPFLLLRCPWCAAQMGPVTSTGEPDAGPRGRRRRSAGSRQQKTAVAGYVPYSGRVVFQCPNRSCEFSAENRRLPVYVVDEDVYAKRPSMVIGTIDKFALLAWRPEARALFGLDQDGERAYSPPELVIQDELHLIAGPLGSMAGLYEGVIEELCTDRTGDTPVPPKLVASTATIRRYEEQVKALYGRDRVRLFPPHGLDASDSFFAVYARDRETGKLFPGRMYVGVHAPALGSMQTTQVRSFAALLQAAKDAQGGQRDPWWTLMAFFNSFRELGNSLSLLQSDIPDYLKTINNRSVADRTALRYLDAVEEMTSRLRQDQVPESMEKLSLAEDTGKAVDVCLASSLIEVGIDIDRLSLMAVVGQPKSTSQYIQVTGRVGRRPDRPGLVVTLYGAAKARDRSHFERFRSYHQRLYAQVEPTSATPFAPPVLDRALHAALVAYIRQTAPSGFAPFPFDENRFEEAAELLRQRANVCDAAERHRVDDALARLRRQWTHWQPAVWGTPGGEVHPNQLMHPVGRHVDENIAAMSWPTPTSMRGADADCRAEITLLYAMKGAQQ
ncbi:helicase-related protein [Streptomyces sp. 7N604]|uniref:helicase-related protein n=1 Tax=Streptomyces sp. 7N604 TaxID=3457415 RepID=UPI003FD0733A